VPLLHRARRVVCGALRRVGRRAAAVTVVALAAVVAAAGPAVAHPTLLRTVPAAGYTGDGPVRQLTLAFDEPVTATADALAVSTAAGSHVPTQPLRREAGGRQLVLPLVNPLTSGQFRVHWQLTAADGDVVDGTFTFGVGTPAPTAVGGGNTAGAAATAALRWILFTALALATGGLVGERLARCRAARSALPTVGAPLRLAAVVGLLAAAGLTGLVAPAAGGWTALTHVRAVELTAVEAGAFAVSLALAMVTPLRRFTAAPLAAVVIAEGLRGHPNAYSAGWGAVLTAVHLGAAAVWVGALVHVVRTAHRWQDDRGRARALLRGYAQIALGLFLLVAATGTVASLLVLRTPRDLVSTGYGRVLAGKLLLVAIVTVLAVLGRRRVRRNTRGATQEPGRVTRVERSALLALLAVTALLVSLPAPQPVAIALTLPPPPDGPTTGFGALIGQVSLGATVSAGQLQLQLSTPGSDPGEQGKDAAADAHVAVTLRTPGAPPVAVPVRGCGRGCFLAATPWRNGVNQLRVEAKTIGWHGGAATFTVPWPPVDATAQLRAVLDALRATGTLTLTEGVTSDTTGPTAVRQLRVTSSDFLESEPYGNGGAPTVTALPRQAGAPRLAVAYPAVGVYITFTLDGRDRPTREVEATPNHLITRTFRYPTP
jgi:copper transport protein